MQSSPLRGQRCSDLLEEHGRVRVSSPPLHEQRRIAEILSSVDEAIAATRAVIEQTGKVKQGVLERLLTKGIGHTRFKQTEIGEIPDGWELKPVDELCVLSNGNGFRPPDWSDKGLPIIRIQNLNGSKNFNYFDGTPIHKWLIHPAIFYLLGRVCVECLLVPRFGQDRWGF